jgi:hypothetical protein
MFAYDDNLLLGKEKCYAYRCHGILFNNFLVVMYFAIEIVLSLPYKRDCKIGIECMAFIYFSII